MGKTFDSENSATRLYYGHGEIVVLYYKYPVHREGCIIRVAEKTEDKIGDFVLLPGLSCKVTRLISVQASGVDKLRRAVSFLNAHFESAYNFPDSFYIRLYFLLRQSGRLNYNALRVLAGRFQKQML
jgi:hypothetical protein